MLILTVDTGAGHRTVARVLAGELEGLSGGAVIPVVANAFGQDANFSPVDAMVQGGYGALIRHAPPVWGALYNLTYHRRAFDALAGLLEGGALRRMARLLERMDPALVVASHPLALYLAARALHDWEGRGEAARAPLWAVVTDLVAIHPTWVQPGVERYVVGSPAGAAALGRQGVPAARVAVTGLPISHAFSALGQCAADPPRLRTVLVSGGGEGAGRLVAIARAILAADLGVEVIAVCGRNRAAVRALKGAGAGRLQVHGYVDDMAGLLARADVVVAKAGSVTVAEAAAAARPLIVAAVLPGQEAGNPALLASHGAGVIARGPEQVVQALRLLRAEPARLAALAAGCRRLARPNAGACVAQGILKRLACAEGSRAGRASP